MFREALSVKSLSMGLDLNKTKTEERRGAGSMQMQNLNYIPAAQRIFRKEKWFWLKVNSCSFKTHSHTHSSFEALAVSTIQHIRVSGCVIHTHLKQCVLLISALLTRWLRLDLKRKKYSKKIERLRSWMLVNSHCALQSNSIRFNFTYILPNHINNVVYIL